MIRHAPSTNRPRWGRRVGLGCYRDSMTPPPEEIDRDAGRHHDRHALTYRPSDDRYEWLRLAAFRQRRSMQSILDEALDQFRAPAAPASETAGAQGAAGTPAADQEAQP
jgi:hypothetical protein